MGGWCWAGNAGDRRSPNNCYVRISCIKYHSCSITHGSSFLNILTVQHCMSRHADGQSQ